MCRPLARQRLQVGLLALLTFHLHLLCDLATRWDAEVVRTLRARFLGEGRPESPPQP